MIALTLIALLSAAKPLPSPVTSPLTTPAPSPSSSTTSATVGDTAPDFTIPSDDGTPFTLSSLRNKKTVVLVFFPKAFTGG